MTYVRSVTVLVRVNTGPPTWWMPNASLIRHRGKGLVEVRLGWLRAAVQVGIGSRAGD